jgi:LEA14-like dessication related protein
MKKIILSIFIILILAFPFYQLYSLNSVEFQSFSVQEISLNSRLYFVVNAAAKLYNPSYIPVEIKEIRYVAYIQSEEIMNGTIAGSTIPSKSSESFAFEQTINWVPDIETAMAITQGKNVTMTISTEADVSYLYFFTITGKKQSTIEISRILKPVLDRQITAISDALGFFS